MEKLDFLPLAVTLEESERQTILMACSCLERARPGWEDHIERVADKLQGRGMLAQFRCHDHPEQTFETLRAISRPPNS